MHIFAPPPPTKNKNPPLFFFRMKGPFIKVSNVGFNGFNHETVPADSPENLLQLRTKTRRRRSSMSKILMCFATHFKNIW